MKHHLTILIIVVRLAIGAALLTALTSFTISGILIFKGDHAFVQKVVKHMFMPDDTPVNLIPMSIFIFLYGIVLIYGALGATRIFYCLLNIKNAGIFYDNQAEEFKRAGENLILFAFLDYALWCITNIVLFNDYTIFISGIPEFLGVYLIGESLLAVNYIFKKGEVIKQENDLTV
jgi:hypothetical protein